MQIGAFIRLDDVDDESNVAAKRVDDALPLCVTPLMALGGALCAGLLRARLTAVAQRRASTSAPPTASVAAADIGS